MKLRLKLLSLVKGHHHYHVQQYLSFKLQASHHTSSSSSSSDETNFEKRKARSMAKSRNRCLPMNLSPEDLMTGTLRFVVGFSNANHNIVKLLYLFCQILCFSDYNVIFHGAGTGQKLAPV